VEYTERRLRIEIRDHGPGIAVGDEAKIFDAFRTNKTHGTGLGLAIAKRIVELHDGTLVGHNHPSGGAVFVIEIPV
jgi:two-component system sensor histidine kinase HydH